MNGIETNRLGGGRGLKYLRFAPLFICLTLAAVVSGGVLLGAVLRLAHAGGTVLGAALWMSGPLLVSICLAFLIRERPARLVFDLALVGLTLMDLAAVAFSLLPFVEGRWILFHLPVVQFLGLTGLLVLVMVVRTARERSP